MEKETEKSVSFHDMQNTEIGHIVEETVSSLASVKSEKLEIITT